MATALHNGSRDHRALSPDQNLLLRETNHRAKNDLQLVVSLLALQSRRAESPETRQALHDAMERVAILTRARAALQQQLLPTLETALRQVCAALHSQAEPRGIEREAVHPAAHIGVAGRDPDANAAGNRDHRRSARSVAVTSAGEASAAILTTAPRSSITSAGDVAIG